MDIVNLIFLIINQLGENEMHLQMRWEKQQKQVKKLYSLNQKLAEESAQKDLKILDLEASRDFGSILDAMISLVNLTVIEEAPRTGELLNQLIDYVKYSSMEKGTFVSLSRDLEQAERFLSMQKQKLGERAEFFDSGS